MPPLIEPNNDTELFGSQQTIGPEQDTSTSDVLLADVAERVALVDALPHEQAPPEMAAQARGIEGR